MKRPVPITNFARKFSSVLRLQGEAAADPTAKTLHLLMLLLLSVTAPHVTIALIHFYNKLVIIQTGFPIVFTPVITLMLLRRNAVRAARVVYLVGMWVGFTQIILLNGGIRSVGWAVYIAMAVSAAWLLGYGAALWTAGAGIGCMLVVPIFEDRGMGPPRLLRGTPIGIWLMMIESTLLSVVPVSLVLSSYRRALARSQRAEAELKAHEQQLEQLVQQRTAELVEVRDQALSANKAKSVFLANMSHELRTPLNAILGFSTLVRNAPDLAEKHRRDIEIVNRSGEHLLSLINDILDVAKIEAGRTTLNLSPCNMRALLQDVADMMQARAAEKHLALVLADATEHAMTVRTDVAKLREVLINLVGNSIKYTDHGSITLRFDARPTGDAARTVLVFEVEDTGIGIAAEDQDRIFEAFEQVANPVAQKGTGLGLAITRQILALMGGSIELKSMPGKGSCFRVSLPVELTEEVETRPTGYRERVVGLESGQPEYRVLVVEDEPENSMVLERLLSEVGFQVRLAQNGQQAVATFCEWQPHFIWMDLRMPVMNGVEATRRIRAVSGGPDVKIVAITASGFESQSQEVLAAGLDDYLRKPYRPDEVFDCLSRHLGVRYRRANIASPVSGARAAISRDAIVALPAALRAELYEAVVSLEARRISKAIEKVAEHDTPLAQVLACYAEKYSYTAILAAVDFSDQEGMLTGYGD